LASIEPDRFDFEFEDVKSLFVHPGVSSDYSLNWRYPDVEGIVSLLCGEYDFSEDRVRKALKEVSSSLENIAKDSTLDGWLT
jgi:flap endonuclease-1